MENNKNINFGVSNSGKRNLGNRNSGNKNTGSVNSGNRNTGKGNFGSGNSGYGNSGHRNSGNWNLGDKNTGHFNSEIQKVINVFNKPCLISVWDGAKKPDFIYKIRFTKWIYFKEMTNQEKKKHPEIRVKGGYLKNLSIEEAWKDAFETATERDIDLLKALPNFDKEVFYKITKILIE